MRKKSWKEMLGVTIIAMSALLVPCIAFATDNSYDITYHFDSNLDGPHRDFGGTNIAVDLDSSYDGPNPTTNTFTVQLYRDHFTGADYIGQGTAPSNGYKTIEWTNVGPGTYNLSLHHGPYGYYVDGKGTFYND